MRLKQMCKEFFEYYDKLSTTKNQYKMAFRHILISVMQNTPTKFIR